MGPKQPGPQSAALFRQPLLEQINAKHPLVRLAGLIDRKSIERSFGAHFAGSTTGRPALPPRLVAGLLRLLFILVMRTLNGAMDSPIRLSVPAGF